MPEVTKRTGRLTSLAFNLTAVDTIEEMGPFEIAPGTQFDLSESFDHEMFPPKELYPTYERRAVRKYPSMGDISSQPRPVLVLGVDAPGAGNAEHHDMAMTRPFADSLPQRVRDHLVCPIVDELQQIEQKHDIEGLMMGDA